MLDGAENSRSRVSQFEDKFVDVVAIITNDSADVDRTNSSISL
jgi:hypothetical protein